MPFPLGEWIDAHSDVPHNLGWSGYKGGLRSVRAALRRPEAPDREALSSELGEAVGVDAHRLFLTHGATEANTLVLLFLARHLAGPRGSVPRFRTPAPEYPPLGEIAEWAGLRRAAPGEPASIALCSDPHNPTGSSPPPDPAFSGAFATASARVIDETFREFTTLRSRSAGSDPGTWTTGTFTKVYGADDIRVGFVVAPDAAVGEFARFHGVVTDEVPPPSVAAARALLRDRDRILVEARSVFAANLALLRRSLPGVPRLRGPIYFDRGDGSWDGTAFAHAAVERGILVCPGAYFGDPSGVRIGLTRSTFADDLAAYVSFRAEWISGKRIRASATTSRRAPRRSRGGP